MRVGALLIAKKPIAEWRGTLLGWQREEKELLAEIERLGGFPPSVCQDCGVEISDLDDAWSHTCQ